MAAKTGNALLIQWSDELRAVVTAAKALHPHVRQHLIANGRGKAYTRDGFSTMWDYTMKRALKAGLTQRFHDLTAKSASDDDLSAATQRLGHTSTGTTERYYRRKPRVVKPLR